VFAHLVEQERPLGVEQYRIRIEGRPEVGQGIVPARQRRVQPRDVELLGQQIAALVIALR
jgi:hypothetical protein